MKGNTPFEKKCYPMSSSVSVSGKKLSNDETLALWSTFDSLSEATKDILVSPDVPVLMQSLQEKMRISDEQLEQIGAVIRGYYLQRESVEWIQREVSKILGQVLGLSVSQYIQNNILTVKPAPKVSEEDMVVRSVKTINLPLLDAIAKYQRLSEQIVTDDRIVVKGEPLPVRGSLRNWLRHYRDAVGIRKHSTMERGQFLFQGDNTKRLSAMERERVSFLLKSLDENTPVSIDTDRQEIIFPAFEERGKAAPATTAEREIPTLETSFRPLEKFPAQTAPIRKALEWNTREKNDDALSEKRSEVLKQKVPTAETAAPFGNITQQSVPEAAKPRVAGVSAPVYAPASPSVASGTPFSQQGNMSFSSSHVLPHEKVIAGGAGVSSQDASIQSAPTPSSPKTPRGPEAISVIRPHGNHSGFRGSVEKETTVLPEDSSDAPRVVNLRSSGGRNAAGRI